MLNGKSFFMLLLVVVSSVLGFLWLKRRYTREQHLTVDEKMLQQMDTLDERAQQLYSASFTN